jgi:hypothetical protein
MDAQVIREPYQRKVGRIGHESQANAPDLYSQPAAGLRTRTCLARRIVLRIKWFLSGCQAPEPEKKLFASQKVKMAEVASTSCRVIK